MTKPNPGIARLARDICLCKGADVARIVAFARKTWIDYAFIGPEVPLEAGIVDQLEAAGVGCVIIHRVFAGNRFHPLQNLKIKKNSMNDGEEQLSQFIPP